jgi:hypothetical protein
MADIKITLTDEDMKRLKAKAADERRTVENMAAYLVAKALEPRKPVMRKVAPKGKASR